MHYYNRVVIEADTFYPSSKICSNCGSLKSDLKLSDRIYHCDECKISLDRDYNADFGFWLALFRDEHDEQ